MQKLHLFPTTVWRSQVPQENLEALNKKLLDKILSLKTHADTLHSPHKWYSNRQLHMYEEFAEFNNYILDAAKTALEQIHVTGYKKLQITGCWANISEPGATHHKHTHPNNYFSGVYYVQSSSGANTITFHDPRPQVGLIRPTIKQHTTETAEAAFLTIEPGYIILFPNWLAHSVAKNESDSNRVSIAFNIMFSDYVENISPPMW